MSGFKIWNKGVRAVVVMGVMGMASAARAQHAGDIVLRVHEGRIETGSGAPSAGTFAPARMFTMTLGEDGIPNFSNEPGYDSEPGTFPVGAAVGLNALDRLWFWSGATFVATGGERMQINVGPMAVMTGTGPVAGFTIDVNGAGQWHVHLGHLLQQGSAPSIDSGVYMLPMELFCTSAAIGASRPYCMVFDRTATGEALDAAREFVRTRVLPPDQPGDTDGDGDVDFVDLNGVLTEFGATGQWLLGDVDRSGTVDFTDLNVVLTWFGGATR